MLRFHPPGRVDLGHIEAGLKSGGELGEVKLSRGAQPRLFPGVHERPARSETVVPAQLDLCKDYILFIRCNQVDLSEAALIARRQQALPLPAQVLCHQGLPPPAQQLGIPAAPSFFRKVLRWMGQGPYFRRSS